MSNKRKHNVRNTVNTYQDWLVKHDGYDATSLESLSDAANPYAIGLVPELLDDAYEKLEKLYYNGELKGRQKQIAALLFEGVTSQVELAKQLNMKQSNVAVELRKIIKKII